MQYAIYIVMVTSFMHFSVRPNTLQALVWDVCLLSLLPCGKKEVSRRSSGVLSCNQVAPPGRCWETAFTMSPEFKGFDHQHQASGIQQPLDHRPFLLSFFNEALFSYMKIKAPMSPLRLEYIQEASASSRERFRNGLTFHICFCCKALAFPVSQIHTFTKPINKTSQQLLE